MPPTDAPVMPPTERLLSLLEPDPTLLARVLLAWAGGWTWQTIRFADGSDGWDLVNPQEEPMGTRLRADGAVLPYKTPDPFRDPAAAWELMVREGLDLEAPRLDDTTYWAYKAPIFSPYARSADPMWAVSLAALHNHADGSLSHLIRPTLERLESV